VVRSPHRTHIGVETAAGVVENLGGLTSETMAFFYQIHFRFHRHLLVEHRAQNF